MKTLVPLIALLLFSLLINPLAAQDERFLIWVFDQGSADSRFGYYNGTTAVEVGGIFKDYDIEALACLNRVIYAASGLDGRRSSELFTVTLDRAANQTTLTKVGTIETRDHQPYYEVASLSEKRDGTLWGYANDGSQRGIIRIDPTTAVAEMINPARYKVEGIEWLGDTLWLVGNTQFYTWRPGGEITKAFTVASDHEIEALDVIDGHLWINVTLPDLTIIAIDPVTGQRIPGGFMGPNDIESLTYCPLTPLISTTSTPTIANTATPTKSPTVTPTVTIMPSPVRSATATQTVTPVVSRTATPTRIALTTMTPTSTPTPSSTPTSVPTPSDTATSTPTPSASPSPLPTATLTATTTVTPVITPSITPIARTTPFALTPEVTPGIPTDEDDDNEPFTIDEIFLPIALR